jgi:hypothetical protein
LWRPGRVALPRGVHALPVPPRREHRRRCEDRADTSPHTHSRSPFPFTSHPGRAHRGATQRRHCRRTLPRGRASSPSRHSHPNPVHHSARDSSTSSIPCLNQSCGGESEFPFPPPRDLAGISSARRLTVASSLPPLSVFANSCFGFLVAYRSLGHDVTVRGWTVHAGTRSRAAAPWPPIRCSSGQPHSPHLCP